MAYDVFLSYPHLDATPVQAMVAALRARGLSAWFDESDIADFTSITRSITEGLAQAYDLERGSYRSAASLYGQQRDISRRLLGEEHPDTSVSAWTLFLTLREIQNNPAAQTILEENLLWLLQRDPATLGADQRQIREMLQARLRS